MPVNQSQRDAERLAELLGQSRRVVAFTGAGISTGSGIPDFRSPGGLWTRMQPIDFQEFICSADARRRSWRLKIELDTELAGAIPNRGHRAVAELVRRGKCPAVITQNVDGLHQRAGVPDGLMIELHGNGTFAMCLDCHKRYELPPLLDAFRRDETLPVCTACGGIVKPATISFGQPMPEEAMRRAEEETLNCDLFLAIGSSLVVYPAAGFPLLAARMGAELAIINRDPTDVDEYAAFVSHGDISAVLGAAVGVD